MDAKSQIDAVAKCIKEILVGIDVPDESLQDVSARLVMTPRENHVPINDRGTYSAFHEDGKPNLAAISIAVGAMKKSSPQLFNRDRLSREKATLRQLDAANKALAAKGSAVDQRQKALNALIAARKPADFDVWSPERQLAFCNRVELEMDGIIRPECAD